MLKDGKELEVELDPATGKVLETEDESDDDDGDDGDHGDDEEDDDGPAESTKKDG